jgi:hypothetical protein
VADADGRHAALADVLLVGAGGRSPVDIFAEFPGARLVLVVRAGSTVEAEFRDGLHVVVRWPGDDAVRLADLLYAWWCQKLSAQGRGAR